MKNASASAPAPSTAAITTSRRKPSRRDSSVAPPTVVTSRARDIDQPPSDSIGATAPRSRNCLGGNGRYSAGLPHNNRSSSPCPRFATTSSASATPSSMCSRAPTTISWSSRGMAKGGMALIDEPRAEAIYDAMGPAVEISGGSAANTIVGVASFGGARRLRRQGQGRRARPHLRARHPRRRRRVRHAARVRRPVDRALLHHGDAGRRAHHEHLSRRRAGPASERHRCRRDRRRGRSPISKAICGIRRTPRRRSSRRRRSRMAPAARVALTLSDAFCVDRYRAEFLDLIRNGTVDHRVRQRARAAQPLPDRRISTPRSTRCAATPSSRSITRSEKGCLVVTREQTDAVPAAPIEKMVDATGAGDLFAAGFLFGLARGARPPQLCPAWGAGGGRSDPAHGRAAGNVAEGAGRGRRIFACKRLRSRRFRQRCPHQSTGNLGVLPRRRGTVAVGWHYGPRGGADSPGGFQ